jgi:[acyl-carrier-protein] S-malonyltransferase
LPLSVAGAYHSRLMQSAQPKLAAALASISFQPPAVQVLSNVTAQPHQTPREMANLLIQQLISPVRWEASMRHLLNQGFRRFIELGPGRTLHGFIKRMDPDARVFNIQDVSSLEIAVETLAQE